MRGDGCAENGALPPGPGPNCAHATVTAATYTALGAPGYISKQFDSGSYLYRYVVRDVVSFNASVGYRFKQEAPRVLRNSSIRLGVINLTDREPPHTSDQIGFSAGVHGSLFQGRAWTLELTKQL